MRILDQTGRVLLFEKPPKRVVSLVPSITELVYDLGFELVGKTKFCVHPDHEASARIIGGTKRINLDQVKELKPDLVLANKEENTKSDVLALVRAGIPVFVSDVATVNESQDLINMLGEIGGFELKATALNAEIATGFQSISPLKPTGTALYLIWQNPYMAAGTDTYISDVLSRLGIGNVLSVWHDRGQRYPEISLEQIKKTNPDFILLSTEPYPFKESHCKKLERELGIPTVLADGECFSWYGSRQAKSTGYLARFSRLLGNKVVK